MPIRTASWITGWGMPLDWWRATAESLLPQHRHCFYLPGVETAASALEADIAVAWSLGAHYMMEHLSNGYRPKGRVLLLSPFLAFCREHACGGKHSATQLRWLRRWVERDRTSALQDFYSRAGLRDVDPSKAPPAPVLLNGLQRLSEPPSSASLSWAERLGPEIRAIVGGDDALVDASRMAAVINGCRVLPGVGHSAIDLLLACPEVLGEV